MALTAMLVFAIIGTIMVACETLNWLLATCDQTIMHPVFLSTVVIILEELPLAGLRWNLKTASNNQMADGWGIAAGVSSMVLPLLGPVIKGCKMLGCCKSCFNNKTYCDDMCTKEKCGCCGACFLIFLAVIVVTINVLNWKDVKAPGAELCV